VPGLNLHEHFDSCRVVGMMRNGMERLGNADMVVRPISFLPLPS
jgi:hypothetical protein